MLGTVLALMRLSGNRLLHTPAKIYINAMRSIPLVMVILWFYLLMPSGFYTALGAGTYRKELSATFTFIDFK